MHKIRSLIICLCLLFSGCENKESGECNYKSFSRIVYVTNIIYDTDGSVLNVKFETGGASNNQIIVLSYDDMEKAEKNFNFEVLKNKTKFYLLVGNKLKAGNCEPFILESIKLM